MAKDRTHGEDDCFVVYGLIDTEYFRVEVLHSIPGTENVFIRVLEGDYMGMQGKIKASRLLIQSGVFEKFPNGGGVEKCG